MRFYLSLSLALALLPAGACSTELDAETGTGSTADGGVETDAARSTVEGLDGRLCPEDSALRYQNFGAPFFYAYCTGCHSEHQLDDMRQGAPLSLNFDTIEKIREQTPLIFMAAADSHTRMPPIGGPDEEQRNALGDWLACGAPD